MKLIGIAAIAGVLFATGCSATLGGADQAKLDESCKFDREVYEPRGDGEVKIAVYKCDKGEVEIGR